MFLIPAGVANILRILYGRYIDLFVLKLANVFEFICSSKIKAIQNDFIRNFSISKQWLKFMPDIIIVKPHKNSIKKPVLYQVSTVATPVPIVCKKTFCRRDIILITNSWAVSVGISLAFPSYLNNAVAFGSPKWNLKISDHKIEVCFTFQICSQR